MPTDSPADYRQAMPRKADRPPQDGRLTLLGTGTCQLETRRAASAVLVELPGLRLVYDFGRGTAVRLVELGLAQNQVRHIVLSHFHTDHWSDLLPYLQAASHSPTDARTVDLEIHATSEVLGKLERLFDLFAPGELIAQERFRVHLRPVRGERLEVEQRAFGFVHLPPAGNHGLRSRDSAAAWALTGDSYYHQRAVDFLRGNQLAVIDAGHLDNDEIVALAAASQVPRIVCSHLYRELDPLALGRRAAAAGYRGRLEVGRDLQVLPLGRPERDPTAC